MRRVILVCIAVTLVLSACSSQEQIEWRDGPVPACNTTSRGRLLLMAQSVPDASLIPCIGELPPGWEFVGANSRTSESVLRFTTDTFDLDVEVVLTGSCEMSVEDRAESLRPDTELYIQRDGRTYSYAFSGGCIEFVFETRELAGSNHGTDLIEAVPFMTRDELRDLTGWVL